MSEIEQLKELLKQRNNEVVETTNLFENIEYVLDELQQKENTIKKIEKDINNIKDIVKKQPSDDPDTDLWIQIRMNGLLFIINEGRINNG